MLAYVSGSAKRAHFDRLHKPVLPGLRIYPYSTDFEVYEEHTDG